MAGCGAAAVLVVSGLDHRFDWSAMPGALSILGDVMVAVGSVLLIVRILEQ